LNSNRRKLIENPKDMAPFIIPFSQILNKDVAQVGGKNASLGEMLHHLSPLGIRIPDGFATTANAFRYFLQQNNLVSKLEELLDSLDKTSLENLSEIGKSCRELVLSASIPKDLEAAILENYRRLGTATPIAVAVRSSATAEDLPTASFAGQHDSFLNISGEKELLHAVQKCYASLFNDRAIKYRLDNGFDHMQVALSAGIQKMVRSDLGSAGVAFTNDPETGFENIIYITGAWGLGENVVQGAVNPDEFYAFKPNIEKVLAQCDPSENGFQGNQNGLQPKHSQAGD
jgi:pyruvate, water dikinase